MLRKSYNSIKSAWVLGSTSEIAKSICIELAKKGCTKFHLLARNNFDNKQFADVLSKKYGVIVTTDICDLSKNEKTDQLKKIEIDNYDLYLIAAGTMGNNKLAREDFLEAQNIININFFSLVEWITKIVTKKRTLLDSRLWILSSVAGDRGRPSNYQYGSAKAGLTTFCEGIMHICYGKPFKVRIIKAGYIATKMTLGNVPRVLCAEPQLLAKMMIKNQNKRGIEYFPKWWFFLMFIVKLIPSRYLRSL